MIFNEFLPQSSPLSRITATAPLAATMRQDMPDDQRPENTDGPVQSDGEKPGGEAIPPGSPPTAAVKPDDGLQYLSGVKLVLVLSSMTVIFFLMMLDGSILATVRTFLTQTLPKLKSWLTDAQGNPVHHGRVPFSTRCRVVWQRIPALKVYSPQPARQCVCFISSL
jgi:hypothetical protein